MLSKEDVNEMYLVATDAKGLFPLVGVDPAHVIWLIDRVRELEGNYRLLTESCQDANVCISRLVDVVAETRNENARLVFKVAELEAALEWYADQRNYDDNGAPRESERGDVFFGAYDEGDRARAALGKEDK